MTWVSLKPIKVDIHLQLNVPFLLYEVSLIYIHNNIKTTYFQVVLYLISKSSSNNQSGALKEEVEQPLEQNK